MSTSPALGRRTVLSTCDKTAMMQPTRAGRAGIVDLLDRVLEKGLVLDADLIISLAGVPLIAVSLRAAIAGVETMAKYGMMRELIGKITRPTASPPLRQIDR